MKKRVYELSRELGLSSEALMDIIREVGVTVKSHMSSLEAEEVEKINAKIHERKEALKAEYTQRQHRQAEMTAREKEREHREREQAAAAAAAAQEAARAAAMAQEAARAAAAAQPAAPAAPAPAAPAQRPASREQAPAAHHRPAPPRLAPGPPPRPQPQGQQRTRGGRKKRKQFDEKLVRESVRRTVASMDLSKRPRRHHRHEDGAPVEVAEENVLQVAEFLTVGELAEQMGHRPQELIASCLRMGLLAGINQRLDKDTITLLADEFGFLVDFLPEYGVGVEEAEEEKEIDPERLRHRAPVVTIMGHVDHGKTSLLDRIRASKLTETEAGGMTQHIGAYQVKAGEKNITFLDTPGHEAFTAMRARGAQVTDIVILVVAADDGVMPQTIEAIDHARAAGVPIIVAINKVDLPGANPDRVKKELADRNVLVEEYGGKVVAVPVSAKQGTGIERLLEMILLVADFEDLKADPDRTAKGVVIEARVEQGRGPVATVLVQQGTLRVGDAFVSGLVSGKVRALFDDTRRRIDSAGPALPVEVLGFSGPPQAGDTFQAVASETEAREIGTKRTQLHREHEFRMFRHVTLADVYERIQQGETNELRMVVKGDVQGSVEVLADQFQKLGTSEVKVNIIHGAVGQINESDVLLAAASDAVIIGFHTRPDPKAQMLASREKVDIRLYEIIYEAIQDVRDALSGLLKPERVEKVIGTTEVRQVFRTSGGGVAGCYVTSGQMTRQARIRVVRETKEIFDGRIGSLKRFKDDVRDVQAGFECGVTLEGFEDFHEGDILEAYTVEEVARKL